MQVRVVEQNNYICSLSSRKYYDTREELREGEKIIVFENESPFTLGMYAGGKIGIFHQGELGKRTKPLE